MMSYDYDILTVGSYETVRQLRAGLRKEVMQIVIDDLHASFDDQYKKGDPYRAVDFFSEQCPERWENVKKWNSPELDGKFVYKPQETTLLVLSLLYLLSEDETICRSFENIIQYDRRDYWEPVLNYFKNNEAVSNVLQRISTGNRIIGTQTLFSICEEKFGFNEKLFAEGKRKIENDRERGIEFSDDGSVLLRYPVNCAEAFYEIPYGVQKIGPMAFHKCAGLKSVQLPLCITEIGKLAFGECCDLEEVNIPASIKKIEKYAFYRCFCLKNIKLPDGIIEIPEGAFLLCLGLIEINLPQTVTKISEFAFESCESLEHINIPDGVSAIGTRAFQKCKSLMNIRIPDSVTTMGTGVFSDCCRLININISSGMRKINNDTFVRCSGLRDIYIPDGIAEIGDYVFFCCGGLRNVRLADCLTKIGKKAFYGCYGTKFNIPGNITEIGEEAFEYCNALSKDDEEKLRKLGYTGDFRKELLR